MLTINRQHNKTIKGLLIIGLLIVASTARSFALVDEGKAVNSQLSVNNVVKERVGGSLMLLPAEQLVDLQRRQADLLANSDELSSLRVQYAHAQLWYMSNDTEFVYRSQELKIRLAQLEQVNTDWISAAVQSLVNLAAIFPGTAPCSYFGSNSLECSISNIQSINNWLQKRNQQIFAATDATAWFTNWAERWQQTLEMTQGYGDLKQDMEQFLADNPDIPVYFQLQQDFSVKSAEVFADADVAAEVSGYAQQFSADVQAILDRTDYNTQLAQYNERSKTLLETNPDYVQLQQESVQLAKSLEDLMQGMHTAIANCMDWGYGNRCFDAQFNYFLQSWLPSYNSAANQALFNHAQLTEKSYQFWHHIAKDPAVQVLQQESADIFKATLVPVLSELQDVQETYIERLFSIEIIRKNLMDLWDQLVDIGEQLGFVQQ
jgi:hypothetical protein